MRRFSLWLALILTPPSVCSWAQTSGQAPPPLADSEKQEVLWQLRQLEACLGEAAALKEFAAREKEQDARERDLAARELEVERQAAEVARKERDLAQEKASLYEQLYRTATKKRSLGCRVLKALTIGLARCG